MVKAKRAVVVVDSSRQELIDGYLKAKRGWETSEVYADHPEYIKIVAWLAANDTKFAINA
jgi:hypothetical protein